MLFDGNYLELNNFSNYSLGADWNFPSEVSEVLALFIHFQGKSKPWEISCLHDNSANFFQNKYREIFNKVLTITGRKKIINKLFLIRLINLDLISFIK